MPQARRRDAILYRIRVEGILPARWAECFDGFAISYEAGQDTVLTGTVADQAALYGVIRRVRDLGLFLVAVERIETDARDQTQ